MKNAKAVIAALVEAFNKNLGVDGLLEVIYRHEVKNVDDVRYYLEEAIYDEDGDGLINETVSVFCENALEFEGDSHWDDDHGDHDGYFEKQYYQNPAGKCEDAPCCGCCGYM
jgi:hypothetical protein